jgi:SulP family sulfate permease
MPSRLPTINDLVAGGVVSLIAISFYVSTASLMFQGTLSAWLPAAIGTALLGGFVLSTVGALRSSQPLASRGPEPAAVPVLASLVTGTVAGLQGQQALATAVVVLALAAGQVGLAWWWIGRRGAGHLVRFIPFPVIGGFMSSVGWLLVAGGLAVSMGRPLSPALLQLEFDPGLAQRFGFALAVGVLLSWGAARIRHLLFLPVALVLMSLAVHGWMASQGLDLEQARARGWLMQPFAQAVPYQAWLPEVLAEVSWSAVLSQSGLLLSVVLIATLSVLLSISSLEVTLDKPANVNGDLKALGLGNVLCAAAGGLAGGVSVGRSVANVGAGARTAWSGFVTGLLCLLAMFWGGPLIALVPKAVLGGLLVHIGLGMLKTWLVDSRSRLTTADFLTLLAMVVVTAAFGFVPAVFLGVIACCLDFAFSSARLAPVRRLMTRSQWPAHLEYGPPLLERVIAAGRAMQIVELQGVLFFGSVMRLVQQVEGLLKSPEPPRTLLLDFQQVPWIDSSAGQALARLVKEAAAQKVSIEFSGVDPMVLRALRATGCLSAERAQPHASIDQAVSRWDDAVLAEQDAAAAAAPLTGDLLDSLAADLGSREAALAVLARFDALELQPGQVLFEQGESADALYFVQHGRLVATAERDGRKHEVRTLMAGSAVGEMGLFRDMPRSATLTAVLPSRVLRLKREHLRQLEAQSPPLAAALYRLLIRQLASRLDQANAQASALSR